MTDPTSLAEYEQAVPGCGKDILQRFFDRTEQEQQHRHKLDRDVFEAERLHAERLMKQGDRSQWMALVIALAGFAIVAYALYLDHPWVAGVVATFDIGGLASMFMYGRKKQAEEQSAQLHPVAPPEPREAKTTPPPTAPTIAKPANALPPKKKNNRPKR